MTMFGQQIGNSKNLMAPNTFSISLFRQIELMNSNKILCFIMMLDVGINCFKKSDFNNFCIVSLITCVHWREMIGLQLNYPF